MDEDLRRYLDAMMAKINANHEAVLNALTNIRDDIGVNMASVERVQEANDGTRQEVRLLAEQVSIMHRQIQRLQTQMRELRGEP